MKILIAVSNNRSNVNVLFIHALNKLVQFTAKYHQVQHMFYDYYDVSAMRNHACKDAVEKKLDYVFLVDADMTYPDDSVLRLLSHEKDIVSGYYVSRRTPHNPVHFKEFDKYDLNKEGNHILPNTEHPLQEEACGGAGGLLVKVSALEKIGSPWFNFVTEEKGHICEDIFFCQKAKENGFPSYVDTSLMYGHIINAVMFYDKKIVVV